MTIELEAELKFSNVIVKPQIIGSKKTAVSNLIRLLEENVSEMSYVQHFLALFQYDLKSIDKYKLKVLKKHIEKVSELLRKQCGISKRKVEETIFELSSSSIPFALVVYITLRDLLSSTNSTLIPEPKVRVKGTSIEEDLDYAIIRNKVRPTLAVFVELKRVQNLLNLPEYMRTGLEKLLRLLEVDNNVICILHVHLSPSLKARRPDQTLIRLISNMLCSIDNYILARKIPRLRILVTTYETFTGNVEQYFSNILT